MHYRGRIQRTEGQLFKKASNSRNVPVQHVHWSAEAHVNPNRLATGLGLGHCTDCISTIIIIIMIHYSAYFYDYYYYHDPLFSVFLPLLSLSGSPIQRISTIIIIIMIPYSAYFYHYYHQDPLFSVFLPLLLSGSTIQRISTIIIIIRIPIQRISTIIIIIRIHYSAYFYHYYYHDPLFSVFLPLLLLS